MMRMLKCLCNLIVFHAELVFWEEKLLGSILTIVVILGCRSIICLGPEKRQEGTDNPSKVVQTKKLNLTVPKLVDLIPKILGLLKVLQNQKHKKDPKFLRTRYYFIIFRDSKINFLNMSSTAFFFGRLLAAGFF